jgi:hypothetical protein
VSAKKESKEIFSPLLSPNICTYICGNLEHAFFQDPPPPGEILPYWIEFRCFRIYAGRELRKPPEVKKIPRRLQVGIFWRLVFIIDSRGTRFCVSSFLSLF